jgi:hypothetical protein
VRSLQSWWSRYPCSSLDRAGVAIKAPKATQLIRKVLTTQTGMISNQVVQEFFNVALRKFSQPMKAADAEQYLGTVFRPLLGVHSVHGLRTLAGIMFREELPLLNWD